MVGGGCLGGKWREDTPSVFEDEKKTPRMIRFQFKFFLPLRPGAMTLSAPELYKADCRSREY
jgi:hypothetical protein